MPQLARLSLPLLVILFLAVTARAQWTQWGGPTRDFTLPAVKLAAAWPDDGPPRLWKRVLGRGHSAIAVDADRLFTLYRRGDQDVIIALRADNGETVWETAYDAPAKEDMLLDYGPGPHSTPLLVGDRVFTVGGLVHLTCLDKATGKILWQHALMEEMSASHLQRGYGASPVAYQDLVIINVGVPDAGVVAFKQDTGEIAWKSETFRPGHPTPLLIRMHGVDQLVLALAADRAALDPATGKTLWKTTVDRQLAGIMTTPLFIPPDRVLFTSAYGGGTQLFRIKKTDAGYEAEELWLNDKMRVMHGTVVRIGDVVYGSSWDFGPALLMAINLDNGKLAWRDRAFAKAALLLVGEQLIVLDETGVLGLVTASPAGLKVHARAQVLEEKAWTVPTLVGTRLYLRDNKTILALDLG